MQQTEYRNGYYFSQDTEHFTCIVRADDGCDHVNVSTQIWRAFGNLKKEKFAGKS